MRCVLTRQQQQITLPMVGRAHSRAWASCHSGCSLVLRPDLAQKAAAAKNSASCQAEGCRQQRHGALMLGCFPGMCGIAAKHAVKCKRPGLATEPVL